MKQFTREDLNEMLKKHEMWLEEEEEGRRANLTRADLTAANLIEADLTRADLTRANLTWANLTLANLTAANLTWANLTAANLTLANLTAANLTLANLTAANLTRADLTRANIDYSCWPLHCGSLNAHVCDRIAVQLLYHTLAVVKNSPNVSDELKEGLLTKENIKFANRFHGADECKVFEEE